MDAGHIDLGDRTVAHVVHDLRNQLAVMIACADNLAALVPRGEADRDMAELRRSAGRASALIRELLTAVRPAPTVRRAIDVNELVASASETLSRAIGRQMGLRLRLSPGSLLVRAGRAELERVLLNLVLNAHDAMEGRGIITVESAAVGEPSTGVTGSSRGPHARLTVVDTGSGLTQDVRRHMFDPFFTTKSMGTGLGLSSVAFTVGQLQGTVRVESQPGGGTSVSVLLPLVQDE
jgi:two-component system, cell cycle sensor histidine kinase and response regulator CckA